MNHDAVELVFVRLAVFGGVVGYAVGRNKQVTADKGELSVGKGDDIGKGIVLEVLQIDGVEVVVGAEDISKLTELPVAKGNDLGNPVRKGGRGGGREGTSPFRMENNVGGGGAQRRNCISTVEPPLMYRMRSQSWCMRKTPRPPHSQIRSGLVGSGRLSKLNPPP